MVRPPNFLRWIYPNAIWNIPSDSKVVYLTFDDGPTPEVTNSVLQILEDYQAKATFFCIGKNIKEHPDLFAQIKQKGHHIGSHTYSHLNGWKTNEKDYLKDYQEGKSMANTNLFRPPYGRLLLKALTAIQKNDKVIMWDILSKDYNRLLTPDKIITNVKRHLQPGSIIVFHDSLKAKNNLLVALPPILHHLREEGYTMSVIPY
jgi:peptidoglycan/xylan/chitin deacetylase (PgdA/CDA1 family)